MMASTNPGKNNKEKLLTDFIYYPIDNLGVYVICRIFGAMPYISWFEELYARNVNYDSNWRMRSFQ
jgi:hypothetical protein